MWAKLDFVSILSIFYLILITSIGGSDENGNHTDEQMTRENKNNDAQYPIECSDDSRIPEHVMNCELLIAGLKSDSGVNRQELCCTLLSSQATKSMCCHQIRDLCESHNANQCPKTRRRIKPPRTMVTDGDAITKSTSRSTTAGSLLFYKVKKMTVPVK